MSLSKQVARLVPIALAALSLLAIPGGVTAADPPPQGAAGGSSADTQVAESKDGFFSSLKQAFSEDLNREVIRGHFDVGAAPKSQRYYCLVDPKSGKRESNGVSGEPFHRHDGMTGIKNAAVTPLSCADAEQKGLLVTDGYVIKGKAASATAAAAAPPAPLPAAAAVPATAAAAAPAPAAPPPLATPAVPPAPAVAAAAASASPPTAAAAPGDILAVFTRFIAAANAHDRSAVAAVMLDSKDFVLAPPRGETIWGSQQSLDALAQAWRGSWKLDPQLPEARVASVAPEEAVLVTPLLLTEGPTTVPVRWSGVFVRTRSGWRIAAIFMTPFADWRPARGG